MNNWGLQREPPFEADDTTYISLSSADESDGGISLPSDNNFPEQDDTWVPDFDGEIPKEGVIGRLQKKQRVGGSSDTSLSQDSFSLGHVASQIPPMSKTDLIPSVEPADDETDPLLLQVLDTFPGISHKYVTDLITRHRDFLALDSGVSANGIDLAFYRDAVYEEILAQESYPKQDSENGKRKREESHSSENDWESDETHQTNARTYSEAAAAVLANEFPYIPIHYVKKILRQKKRLYHAYLTLQLDETLVEKQTNPYVKLKNRRNAGSSKRLESLPGIIPREFNAAKEEAQKQLGDIQKKKEKEEGEKANEEEHTRIGNLIECQCCYSDVPANRCLPCDGIEIHFFCFTCIRRSADTQIGLMRYTLQCFDVSGCQAPFARSELREVLGSLIMDKLDSLEQEDEIQKAGLEGLEDCPFCSFKAVLPPVEEDREFRCENSSCKVTSCRLCKEKSHIPRTCEEFRKDKGLSKRHQVEEAMSKALIRNCPKCQVQIVKEFGCNKMTCTKCHTFMCYICQKDITQDSYRHFKPGGCPQDDMRTQDSDIQKAERTAIDKILAENPEITEEQLRVGHVKPKRSQRRYTARAPMYPADYFLHPPGLPDIFGLYHGQIAQNVAQNAAQLGQYGQPGQEGMVGRRAAPAFAINQEGGQVGNPSPQHTRGTQYEPFQDLYQGLYLQPNAAVHAPVPVHGRENPPLARFDGRNPQNAGLFQLEPLQRQLEDHGPLAPRYMYDFF